MQEKLVEILSAATDFMTAAEIATKGGWRSAANVGVALQQMEKANGQVVRRKSKTKRMSNNMPATEWALSDKDFAKDVKAEMPTDKACCNAAKVVATTAGAEVSELRAEIKRLREANLGLAVESDNRKKRIAELETKLGYANQQVEALTEQLIGDEEAVDVVDAAKGYLVRALKRKPRFLTKPESAVLAAQHAAKATGRGEVFALVPVGVAVRKNVTAVEYRKAGA